ncbi:MAG: NlpC/P60 family protein [Desulfococcaceae bacterium]|jgi:cell wall-associated NlpC family hydrolase|nr:NlpC/P60 family protein [Desulfococcaceae bacterium]
MKHLYLFPDILLLIFLIFCIQGCGSALRYPNGYPDSAYPPGEAFQALNETEEYIWNEVRKWQGVPYKWGGESRAGVDCSGFTKVIYQKLFDIRLPRTSEAQSGIGHPIPGKHFLQAGDLLFFQLPGKFHHVGIYLGKQKFIHASRSKGVKVSSLAQPFWQRSYRTSRRVL